MLLGAGLALAVALGLAPQRAQSRSHARRWKVPFVNPKYYLPAAKGYRDRGCLRLLRALRVPYRRLRHVKGVTTPIRVLGNRIGRTRYVPRYKSNKMIMDCRLAVALARANEVFKANQISALVFSNFYCWRYVEESGRLSRHALGLAVDVHAFIDRKGRRLDVLRDYHRGLGKGRTCEGRAKNYRARVLRDLACDLDASGLFETVLTPDYNKGHHNHFHISVFHPQDRKRYRLFRTVLMEVRGTMYPWTWSRPTRGFYSSGRIRRVVRARWRKRRRWYRWKHRRAARRARSHGRRRRAR